jgi:hypothetical protein
MPLALILAVLVLTAFGEDVLARPLPVPQSRTGSCPVGLSVVGRAVRAQRQGRAACGRAQGRQLSLRLVAVRRALHQEPGQAEPTLVSFQLIKGQIADVGSGAQDHPAKSDCG